MSSNIFIRPETPITKTDWLKFCDEYDIELTRVIGGRTFRQDDVEITFDTKLREWPTNGLPEASDLITVATYFMGDLPPVIRVCRAICKRWPGSIEPSPEFVRLLDPQIFNVVVPTE